MNVYKASIDSDELKKLSVLRPSGTVAALALDWAVIAAAIALSSHFGGVWLYLLAVAVIAGRMHGGYYLGAATLITLLGIWQGFLLYWVVPYMTLFFLFLYVRGVAEHFGSMDYEEELGSTRTVIPYFWERWFFAPHNINYHLEHHLFPGVPFYSLPKLGAALMRDETYRAKAHITRGYATGLLRECLAAAKRDKPGQLLQN